MLFRSVVYSMCVCTWGYVCVAWGGQLDTLCLLILIESLISANWEGQFKQAQRSGCHTSVTWVQRGTQCRVLCPASALPLPTASSRSSPSLGPHPLVLPGALPRPAEWPQSGLFVWTRPLAVSGLQKCEQDKPVDRDADRHTAVWDT